MILTHFSANKLLFDPARKYEPLMDGPIPFKPRGLWLSDETTDWGWRAWCESESFRPEYLKHRTDFEVDLSNWAVIRDGGGLFQFSKKYLFEVSKFGLRMGYLDWPAIQHDFAGILITPYLWECRLDPRSNWYYPWDCASACVWDLRTIMLADQQVKTGGLFRGKHEGEEGDNKT